MSAERRPETDDPDACGEVYHLGGTAMRQLTADRYPRRIVQAAGAIGVVLGLLAGFAAGRWYATPREKYRYEYTGIGSSNLLVRIDNRTGETEILLPQGWSPRPTVKTAGPITGQK